MAGKDFPRIKSNIQKMLDQNATEAEVDEYVKSEGTTAAALQANGKMTNQKMKLAPSGLESAAGYVNKLTQSLASGVTAGFADELAAGLDAPFVAAYRTLVEDKDFDMGKAYADRRDTYRADQTDFRENSPVGYYSGEIAGAVGGVLAAPISGPLQAYRGTQAAIKPLSKAANWFRTPAKTLPRRMGKGAVIGGGYAGAFGAGHSTGGPQDRAEAAAAAVPAGMLIGGLAAPVVELITAVGRAGVQKVLSARGGLSPAEQKLANAIRDMAGGDFKAGVAQVREALSKGGDDVALADVTGQPGVRLARGAANVEGEGGQIATDFGVTRAQGRGARMDQALDELAPGNFHGTLEKINAQKRVDATPLYEEAFAPQVGHPSALNLAKTSNRWTPRLQEFLDDPIIHEGLAAGAKVQRLEALAEGRPYSLQDIAIKSIDERTGQITFSGTPNVRMLDAAKRGLDQMLEHYRDPQTGRLVLDQLGRAIENVRKSLVKELDNVTTDPTTGRSAYAEARKAWAGPSQLNDAAWLGRRFMRGDEEVISKTVDAMTPAEREMFELGVRRELSKMVTKDTQTAPGKFADKKADLWGRVGRVFSPEKVAEFKRRIDLEITKARTEAFVSPASGSPTQGRTADVDAFKRVPMWAGELVKDAASGDLLRSVTSPLRGAGRAMSALNQPSAPVAKDVAKMIFDLNKVRQTGYLTKLEQVTLAEDIMSLLGVAGRKKLTGLLNVGGSSAARSFTEQ